MCSRTCLCIPSCLLHVPSDHRSPSCQRFFLPVGPVFFFPWTCFVSSRPGSRATQQEANVPRAPSRPFTIKSVQLRSVHAGEELKLSSADINSSMGGGWLAEVGEVVKVAADPSSGTAGRGSRSWSSTPITAGGGAYGQIYQRKMNGQRW